MADPLFPERDDSTPEQPPTGPPQHVQPPSSAVEEYRESLGDLLTLGERRIVRKRLVIIGASVVAAIAVVLFVWWWLTPAPIPTTVRGLAVHYARETGLESELVLAVIQVESSGKADAVSKAGARGLMQLMPRTAEEVAAKNGIPYTGPDDLFDPALNIRMGTLYLAYLKRFFKDDLWLTLAAYNGGIGRIDRLALQNPELSSQEIVERLAPDETKGYVPKVLAALAAERRRSVEEARPAEQ
jgi:soluble lytic murein transglycosylase-like protein